MYLKVTCEDHLYTLRFYNFDYAEGLAATGAFHLTLAADPTLEQVTSAEALLQDLRAVHRIAVDQASGVVLVRGPSHPVCQVSAAQVNDIEAKVYP